jgi:diaminopimelate decarboxylase
MVDTVATNGEFPDLISFRLNPGLGRTDSSTKSNVLGGPDAKFGVPPDQILGAYKAAKAAGARRFGIHMMTGSCVLKEEYWSSTIALLVETMAKVQHELGIAEFEFVNIGGGMGLAYEPEERPVNVVTLVQRLKTTLATQLVQAGIPPPRKLYMENGRFITGPYGWLVSRIHATKHAFGAKYLGVDANMAHLMRPGMYGSYHHISVPQREERGGDGAQRVRTNVVGTLCENNDWFAKDRLLAQDAGVGDLVIVHDTGAHSASMGFQYNGKLRAPELLLRRNGQVHLIRHRETYDTLYSNTQLPLDLLVGKAQLDFSDGASISQAAASLPTKVGSQESEAVTAGSSKASSPGSAQASLEGQRGLITAAISGTVAGLAIAGLAVWAAGLSSRTHSNTSVRP